MDYLNQQYGTAWLLPVFGFWKDIVKHLKLTFHFSNSEKLRMDVEKLI